MKNKTKSKKIKNCALILGAVCCLSLTASAAFANVNAAETSGGKATAASLWESVKFAEVTEGALPDWYKVMPAGADELNLLADRGVKIVNSGSGATVRYKNEIDMNSMKKEDVLVQIAPVPSTLGSPDFKQLELKFTDVENADDYVTITIFQSQWYTVSTFYQVGTKDIVPRGLYYGYYGEGSKIESGLAGTMATWQGVFNGYNREEGEIEKYGATRPITLSFDSEEKAFYTEISDGSNNLLTYTILDLDDPRQVGLGYEWKGFTSGRVKLEITASSFLASEATYIITGLNGCAYGESEITDTAAPNIYTQADRTPEILVAQQGKEYPLFQAVASDFIDGYTDIDVYYKNPNSSQEVLIEGDSFVPSKLGDYLLIYKTQDKSGNAAEKEYVLTVRGMIDGLEISLDNELVSESAVGEKIILPNATVTGGVGEKQISLTVTRIESGEVVCENQNSFTPKIAGTYAVEYLAVDYLNSKKYETRYVTVKRANAPICSFGEFPRALISGKTVELPELVAFDYSSIQVQGQAAAVDLYASFDKNVKGEKIERLFTPVLPSGKTEATLYITAETYCVGHEADAVTKVYEVALLKAEQVSDYFYKDGITAVHSANYIDFVAQKDGATMRYVNPLAAKNFEIQFDVLTDKNNFDAVLLEFTDSLNSSQKISVKIERNDGSERCYAYVNGMKYEMVGGFNGESNDPMHLTFKTADSAIVDHKGNVVSYLKKYLDGSAYTGFDSDCFYVDVTFLGVRGESALRFYSIGNQAMFAEYDRDNNLIPAGDYAEPIVIVSGENVSEATVGDTVNIAPAKALDTIDSYVECYVRVLKDGKTVMKNRRAEKGASFLIEDFGTYVIRYSATDESGNEITLNITFRVRDKEAPVLSVNGSVSNSYSVGTKVTFPKAFASDDASATKVRLYVITPMGKMIDVTSTYAYTFASKGKYVLRYCAYDASYNMAITDYSIEIK